MKRRLILNATKWQPKEESGTVFSSNTLTPWSRGGFWTWFPFTTHSIWNTSMKSLAYLRVLKVRHLRTVPLKSKTLLIRGLRKLWLSMTSSWLCPQTIPPGPSAAQTTSTQETGNTTTLPIKQFSQWASKRLLKLSYFKEKESFK